MTSPSTSENRCAPPSDNLREQLDQLCDLTPEQLKTVVEFVKQAGSFDCARAAIEALEELSDAA